MILYGRHTAFRALGLFLELALTLFFLACPGGANAAESDFDVAFSGYVVRMILALAVLGGAGYAALRFLPGRFPGVSRGHIRVLGAVNLGRDMIYVVRTGPDVVAFISYRSGAVVLGRWSLEEWDDYEAAMRVRETPLPLKNENRSG